MNCSQVVAKFTDYLDGRASGQDVEAIRAHVASCSTCSRYERVLREGSGLLRSLPQPELREDFGPRLQHRLFHVDSERALRANGASGAPALTVLGIAVLIAAIAWSPLLFDDAPVVRLDPIVVDHAPTRATVRPVAATPPGTFSTKSRTDLMEGLWANTLLYDYSPLSQRYEQRARVRRASEPLGR
ncbi:MAG: zf-HC2 domain-containing protein [Longimicrobiales bacterium]|nr:zf-HC2 domain-containing protein [Longimicrobiales bacterium]